MIDLTSERFEELCGIYWESTTSRRVTRNQRLVAACSFYIQKLSPFEVVWSQDVTNWLRLSDSNNAVNNLTTYNVLTRLTEQGLAVSYWEQFESRQPRPPRVYHQLTEFGTAVAIQHIQELRADELTRPNWMVVPELNGGFYEPANPRDFEVSHPAGALLATQ